MLASFASVPQVLCIWSLAQAACDVASRERLQAVVDAEHSRFDAVARGIKQRIRGYRVMVSA